MTGGNGGMPVDRRRFLTISGSVLGGIAASGTVVAAASDERFVVDTRNVSMEDLRDAVEVVHDVGEIDAAVVRGRKRDLKKVTHAFAPDSTYRLDLPLQDRLPEPKAVDTANEPLYPLQWDKQAQDVSSAHDVTTGEGTRVSVIDTGVAASHPDLDNVNAALSVDFTGDGNGAPGPWGGYHGTHVAGIVGADDENDVGVVGSAPGTEIVDCRVFSATGPSASFGDILAAMVYSAAVGCDVANLSLGAYPVPRQGLGSFYGKLLNRTTSYARRQGTLLVVAAGNDAADLQHDRSVVSLPNEAANVMSISATGPIGFGWDAGNAEAPATTPAKYTNYGTNAIDVSAPGGNYHPPAIGSVPTWYYDLVLNAFSLPQFDSDGNAVGVSHGWGWVAGTSMAAPQVAGAAALVKAANPGYHANKVRSTLARTATDVGQKPYHGAGFVDPDAAVRD